MVWWEEGELCTKTECLFLAWSLSCWEDYGMMRSFQLDARAENACK